MGKKIDIVGQVFGRLTVQRFLEMIERDSNNAPWLCLCECGNLVKASSSNLKNGNILSCGCLKDQTITCKGLSQEKTYSSWSSMIKRCNGLDEMYVEKGRKVCDRWLEIGGQGFLNFLTDMGERPEGTTLERMDNSLDYFPENCKWEIKGKQCYNRDLFKNSTSGKTGVHQRKDSDKWRAFINFEGKRINLRTFTTFDEAVRVREQAELEYYGFIKE